MCRTYSRGFPRHLALTGEVAAPRLLSIHNLSYTLDLVAGARRAISDRRFTAFRREAEERRRPR